MCKRETPDIVTASEDYARRFSGVAGDYFLAIQNQVLSELLGEMDNGTVLDVGGGHGQLVTVLRKRKCDITILGSDSACHNRIRQMEKNDDLKCITADLLNLPFADCSYDLVTSIRLVSHVTAWERLIDELCRVSKKYVIIDYPTVSSLNVLTPFLFRIKKEIEGNTRTYRSFSHNEIAKQFQANNYSIVAQQGQFFLPMVLYRMLRGARTLQKLESILRHVGITKTLGSPVLLLAEKN